MNSKIDSKIVEILKRKKTQYKRDIDHFTNWSIKNCTSSNIKIRKNVYQILTELKIPATHHVSILNSIYKFDFDASHFINRIFTKSGGEFDIFSDRHVHKSVKVCLDVFDELNILPDSFNAFQRVGMCVFATFILVSGRKDLEEFGVVDDLISKWKKKMKKINKKETRDEGGGIVQIDENEDDDDDDEKIINQNVLENWDD